MISKSYIPFQRADLFYGVNSKDSPDVWLDGEWDESSINIFSDPQGALASRPGYSSLTTASIGSATAWTGFYQFRKSSKVDYYLGGTSDGKIYQYVSNGYTQLYTGLTTGVNVRWSFDKLNDICVMVNGNEAPLKWTGTGSAASLGGTICTADFCLEWQRYMWMHSTVDPRLMYYCTTIGDPESGYTSFLNFDDDPYEVNSACKQGDDMIVGKLWSLFRVRYTGSSPIFVKDRIPSRVGPINFSVMKQIPGGGVIFLAPDYNFYILSGDNVIPVGSNIQKYMKAGVNSRITQAVAGVMQDRNQYWCSFVYVSTSTTADRTVVMDYSRPYQDRWGKIQYPWFIYSIGANCFAEIYTSGKAWLYSGGYTGKMYKQDSGTNDDGVAFNTTYKSKVFSHGDTSLEKKYGRFLLSYENKGNWDLDISFVCDGNAATQKSITQNMLGGSGYNTLWDVALWDVDYFSSETDIDIGRDIDRQGKLIQVSFGTDGLDESWRIYSYTILTKGLYRGNVRSRES